MKIKRDNLLTLAGIVWIVAGLNILIIGLSAYRAVSSSPWWALLLMLAGSLGTFGAFHAMFGKLVKKHVARIRGLENVPQNPLLFFDAKSYVIMAFMITLGVTLRASGVVPDWFIAFFYTGLGAALAMAGLGFLLHRKHGEGWSFHRDAPHGKAA